MDGSGKGRCWGCVYELGFRLVERERKRKRKVSTTWRKERLHVFVLERKTHEEEKRRRERGHTVPRQINTLLEFTLVDRGE